MRQALEPTCVLMIEGEDREVVVVLGARRVVAAQDTEQLQHLLRLCTKTARWCRSHRRWWIGEIVVRLGIEGKSVPPRDMVYPCFPAARRTNPPLCEREVVSRMELMTSTTETSQVVPTSTSREDPHLIRWVVATREGGTVVVPEEEEEEGSRPEG